jgi:phosphatidylserine/phosphatidylglycerophosphate/cardiolipin synthase-like enzyme
MKKHINTRTVPVILVLAIAALFLAGSLELALGAEYTAYMSPNGGFASENNSRTFTMPDGTSLPATLTNSALYLIGLTPNSGEIKIAMYSFSVPEVQDVLIKVAGERNIRVKVILDASAEWTADQIKDFIERVKAGAAKYKKFDYQLKLIPVSAFEKNKRTRKLKDGKTIYGTMHEKFGTFADSIGAPPRHSFNGSANLCAATNAIYAEDRVVFLDDPVMARLFEQEFALLWENYGERELGEIVPEKIEFETLSTPVPVFFTSARDRLGEAASADAEIARIMDLVDKKAGTLDVAMFAFTHWDLGMKILDLAKKNPRIKVRILLDLSQLRSEGDKQGLMSEILEKDIKKRHLKNVVIRYKWRANAYGMDEEAKAVQLVHFRSKLMHHKALIVDSRWLVTGSYNWSRSAEENNLENIMTFDVQNTAHANVVKSYLAEFNYIWDSDMVTTAIKGKQAAAKICKTLKDPKNLALRDLIDKSGGSDLDQIVAECGLPKAEVVKRLTNLESIGLIKHEGQKDNPEYSLSD